MSDIVLSVENLWKQYRLGVVGASSLREDVSRWLAKIRGKEDPTLKIGQTNDREHLNGQYVWALQDINFEVKRGEVLGIIGKNGAGKSTLLKILSKVTSPTKGNIKIKGRVSSLLEVGTGFHPELTGRENIFLNGAILGMTKNDIRAKFDEIVDFSGVGKYIDTPVKRYSSGMYVRLAFAVAAHLEPEILIVDEVLAVGDAEFQKKCLGKMKDVSGEGRTVLFVSHNMASIQNFCNSGLLLEQGKIKLASRDMTKVIDCYLRQFRTQLSEPLENRKDRSGEGKIVFTKIRFEDSKGNQLDKVMTGQNISILIDYLVKTNEVMNDIMVALSFRRFDGLLVSVLSTDYYLANFNNVTGKGTFTCKIDEFPLSEGEYTIGLIMREKGVIQDWLVEAVILEVENGDFYGTGQSTPTSHPSVLLKHEWF